MTEPRYHAYRRAQVKLERLPRDSLTDTERELLADVAEGLLLAREADEVDELRGKAAVALSLLVGLGRWSDAAADDVWAALIRCGPSDRDGAPHGSAALQHA